MHCDGFQRSRGPISMDLGGVRKVLECRCWDHYGAGTRNYTQAAAGNSVFLRVGLGGALGADSDRRAGEIAIYIHLDIIES